MVIISSKQFWLNARDYVKALVVASVSAPISIILSCISAGKFTIDWTAMWHLALASGAAYLIKNFFTPAQTVITHGPAPSPVQGQSSATA
jgi:hypothetical protein